MRGQTWMGSRVWSERARPYKSTVNLGFTPSETLTCRAVSAAKKTMEPACSLHW